MEALLTQGFTAAPPIKVAFNIGAGFDIPTGTYIEGRHGEYILNGGLAPLTGFVGIGNMFKTTIMRFAVLCAMARMCKESTGSTYDTEVNVQEWQFKNLADHQEEFHGEDILTNGRWIITDKTIYSGNEWYKLKREFLENKLKNAKKLEIDTPFWNRDRTGPLKILIPTYDELDSFTEFETDDVIEIQEKNELGDSGANTMHMRQGLAKMRFLMEAPRLNCGSYNYLAMTAHIGKETMMQNAGPGGQMPVVKLKHLKHGDKIKGVTDKFTFMTHNCYHCYDARPLINQGTKGPEYPRDEHDDANLDTDLNVVLLRNLRSKSGISGMSQMLIVSQSEGVLPSLTEYHYIKEMDRYGLEGSPISSWLALYPEVKFGRTTVRGKIDSDYKLRRALNITSEMCQMNEFWHNLPEDLLCTPKQLYDDIKSRGYDWNQLLSETRGWWTLNEDHPLKFLSTMDLLRMRKGLYHPYWMKPLAKVVDLKAKEQTAKTKENITAKAA
jgi:hypothetical protein